MKIGLVLPGFSADERDWGIPALYNFARMLAAKNDLRVFALDYPYRRDAYNFFGARVYALNGAHRGKRHAPRLCRDAFAAIRVEHARAPFDVLHAFWVNKAGFIALLAARILRVPFIASVGGGELVGLREINYGGQLHFIERALIRAVLRGATRVTVGSRALQKIAARWRADARVVPLGVDTEMHSPSPLQREGWGEGKILNVGSLLPVKGQENLLRALAHMPRASLEIIGAGPLEKKLRDTAQMLGLAPRVQFTGEIAHDALAAKYRAADVVAQASLFEAQGMAILEAAACGAAIAGTRVGVLPELAEHGAAKEIERWEIRDWVESIEFAFGQRCSLGKRARAIIKERYALEKTHAQWMALYESIRGGES